MLQMGNCENSFFDVPDCRLEEEYLQESLWKTTKDINKSDSQNIEVLPSVKAISTVS